MKELEDEIRSNNLGISWIGQIPDSWDIQALGKLVEIILSNADKKTNDGETKVFLCNYTDVYYKKRINLNLPFLEASATDLEIHRFQLKINDVLITKDSETPDDIAVPSLVTEVKKNLLCGYHLAILRPLKHKIVGGYLFFSLMSESTKAQFSSLATGITRFGIGNNDIKNVRLCLPPLQTQKSIARFLDRKTAAIDTLIAKKQRLIQLLEEKRTALINQAVTKGLNPNAPMKDAGIPWIGEIPEHWEAKLFRRVTSRIDVGIAEAATHAYAEQGIPIVRSANVRTNYMDMNNLAYIQKEFAEKNRSKYIHSGDILTVRTGANAGMTAVVPEALNHVQCFTLLVATPIPYQDPQFYSYYINSTFAQSFFTVEGWGSAQVNLSVPILKELPIVEPSYQEQQEIVTFIRESTERIDELLLKNQQSIEKLQEYRRSLITAAVTGKLEISEVEADV